MSSRFVRGYRPPILLSRAHPLLLALLLSACGDSASRGALFELQPSSRTGVSFANTITTSDSVNVQTDVYIYNGAGVAAGDIDNDGLPDLFFAGNMVSSRLYLNKGELKFEDITSAAGVETDRWATGVSMVDINDDGWLDIYVSVSGPEWSTPEARRNLLFINNKDRTFTESAAAYGVDSKGFTTHAAFLDYDGDGCLDVFLLENSPSDFTRADVSGIPAGMRSETPDSYNQLLRNDCQGHFTNASEQAGILRKSGYGLGVAVADVNNDGRPDLYISNDVVTNDVLYVNNGDGTFTDKRAASLRHASYAGMGVDMADFNNDGWMDVLQVDMMGADLVRRKRTSGFLTYPGVLDSRSRGFLDDFSENTLQLNNGIAPGEREVTFSEVGRMAGVSHTEWSWSALFADFDNDGLKDIFIGNGYPKAVNDLDYMSATNAARRPGASADARKAGIDIVNTLPAYDVSNYVFRNRGDLAFTDETKAWGMDRPSLSYGASYVDLDNDGQLDLVVNNIDAEAFVYRNVQPNDSLHHFLGVILAGDAPNRRGIGARLAVTAGGTTQYLDVAPYRGFMSTMDDRAHFGLGRAARVDTLEVTWPDGRRQRLTDVAGDRYLTLKQSDASAPGVASPAPPAATPFTRGDAAHAVSALHQASNAVDYSVQPLLPYLVSRQGPPLATADVNGDGLDDVYVGGGPGSAGVLYLQNAGGGFARAADQGAFVRDKDYDDWGAQFLDANGDGRPDLYVASGGYTLSPSSALLQDRLYLNQGNGRFARDSSALPAMLTSTSAIAVGDFTGDGRPDLFVGGRLSPRDYPLPARSYLLRNDGGRFSDVTTAYAPSLAKDYGMVTAAQWLDFDGDGRLDLVTAGEWMALQFLRGGDGTLSDATAATTLPALRGWWYSLAAADVDKDGRPDLVAGNLGLNYHYTTSDSSRFGVVAADFTGNRTTDIILTEEHGGVEYSVGGMVPLGRELYTLGLRFPTFASFATASLQQLFEPAALEKALHYQADTFESLYLHNEGGGRFTATPLPRAAQVAPVRGIVTHDVDGDGHLDLVVAGNLYDAEPNIARADAGNGLWLKGDGAGHFSPVPARVSGLFAPKNVSGLALGKTASGHALFVGNTGDSVQTFLVR